jgi:hypothetical protein
MFEYSTHDKKIDYNVVFKNSNPAFRKSQKLVIKCLMNLGPFLFNDDAYETRVGLLDNFPYLYDYTIQETNIPAFFINNEKLLSDYNYIKIENNNSNCAYDCSYLRLHCEILDILNSLQNKKKKVK